MSTRFVVAIGAALLLAGPALAAPAAPRTIEVTIGDLHFSPAQLDVVPGETVRLVVRNTGALLHEFRIGTPAANQAHEAEMAGMVDHGMFTPTGVDHAMMGHMSHGAMHAVADGGPATVGPEKGIVIEPGQSTEMLWTVPAAAAGLEFACTMPGHMAAGMTGPVVAKSR